MDTSEVGTATIVASSIVEGDLASAFLAEMISSNPTYAGINGTANASPFVVDLTLLDTVSQHVGTKFKLKASGAEASTKTLAGKPVHVTTGFMGHQEAGKSWKPVGVMLGGKVVASGAAQVVRVAGLLWEQDFPSEVSQIRASKALMGASWEIKYPKAKASKIEDGIVEIEEWTYSGSAILLKNAAAYPDTAVLHASDDSDADDEKDKKKKKPWQKPWEKKDKEAKAMVGKYATYSLPDGTDEAVISQIVKDAIAEVQSGKEIEALRAQVKKHDDDMKAQTEKHAAELAAAQKLVDEGAEKLATVEARATAAETSLAEITTQHTELTAKAEALETEKAAAKLKVDADAWWKAYATKNGLSGLAQAEVEKRRPLIEKAVQDLPMTATEWASLGAGAKPAHEPQTARRGAVPAPVEVPLVAGDMDTDSAMAEGDLLKLLPALGNAMAGRPTIR